MNQFDFVWTIRLRDVDKGSTLPQQIKQQHGQLKKVTDKKIMSILKGQTGQKVALLLDGYDQYKRGRNIEIDRAIESGIGNCFIIVTSRLGHSGTSHIRPHMDGEMTIEGLSVKNIRRCSDLYLANRNERREMLKQARAAGIYTTHRPSKQGHSSRRMRDDEYLRVPIILLMICSVYDTSNHHLPKKKAEILKSLFSSFIQRSKKESPAKETDFFIDNDNTIHKLGKLSWEALQEDEKPFHLSKVDLCQTFYSSFPTLCISYETQIIYVGFIWGLFIAITLDKNVYSSQRDIEKECNDILNWGVMKAEIAESGDYQDLIFLHPILQWFAAAWYISKEVE